MSGVPAPAAATPVTPSHRRHAVFHELRVSDLVRLTDDSVAITFEVPEALRDAYVFTQGQHVSLRCAAAGDDVRRSYSICTPAGSGRLAVAVKQITAGIFSEYALTKMRAGDSIEVMTPAGRFGVPLEPAAARIHVAIAAGSGITPILSIISTTLAVERESRVTLIYGNRTSRSIMFLEELEDLKNRYPDRFALFHVLSREPQEVDLLSGRLDEPRLRALLSSVVPVDCVDEWFLCGPAPMVRTARGVLADSGVDLRHVHAELFHADPQHDGLAPTGSRRSPVAPPATPEGTDRGGASTAVTIVLDGRSSSFTMSRHGEAVLDAALRVRDDAPFACRGGVCSTCRARLLVGEVRMDRNWALEESEVRAGYVLACQSHPLSDTLTLDFDG